MHTYELTYRRVMTLESETKLSEAELREIAKEDLYDEGALWNVEIGGRLWALR